MTRDCAGCLIEAELAAMRAANERALLFGDESAVCGPVEQERGAITFASSTPKPGAADSLVRPMDSSDARYLGLLYLEAMGWI